MLKEKKIGLSEFAAVKLKFSKQQQQLESLEKTWKILQNTSASVLIIMDA